MAIERCVAEISDRHVATGPAYGSDTEHVFGLHWFIRSVLTDGSSDDGAHSSSEPEDEVESLPDVLKRIQDTVKEHLQQLRQMYAPTLQELAKLG